MGDFIKELTIIDFLGMIVPGGMLVLLFSKDYELQNIWRDYFENDMVANTIILLIAGYLIGMLIHELGDILEKQIWKMNRLNPRYYAAKEVFLNVGEKYKCLDSTEWQAFKNKCEKNAEDKQENNAEGKRKRKRILLSVISLWIFCLALLFLPFLLKMIKKGENIGTIILILLIVVAIYAWAVSGLIPTKKEDAEIIGYLKQNAAIQTEIFGKATAAKRQIFDGFYCVMRNFLIVIGITNVYSVVMMISGETSNLLSEVDTFYQDGAKIFIYYIVVVGMLHRCWHYAFLKYKYTYEDYLYILKQKEKKPSSNNKSMVISVSNRGQT